MFNNLYDGLPLFLRVVLALLDYMIKASSEYRFTEDGAREWQDFTLLYEQMLNNDANDTVEYGFEARSQAASAPKQARSRQTTSRQSVSEASSVSEDQFSDPNMGKR